VQTPEEKRTPHDCQEYCLSPLSGCQKPQEYVEDNAAEEHLFRKSSTNIGQDVPYEPAHVIGVDWTQKLQHKDQRYQNPGENQR
jgi:hypothetical protein